MRFFQVFSNWIRAHALASSLVFLAASPFVAFEIYASDYATRYDDCTFGNVSNARYRELLWRARWQHWVWDTFRFTSPFADRGQDHQAANENLKRRVLDVSSGTDNPQELIAAFHAVMRSLGANLVRRTESGNAKYDLYTSGDLETNDKGTISNNSTNNTGRSDKFILNSDYFKPSFFSYMTFCLFFCERGYSTSMSNSVLKIQSENGAIIQTNDLKTMIAHTYPLGAIDFYGFRNEFITFSNEAPKCPWVPAHV